MVAQPTMVVNASHLLCKSGPQSVAQGCGGGGQGIFHHLFTAPIPLQSKSSDCGKWGSIKRRARDKKINFWSTPSRMELVTRFRVSALTYLGWISSTSAHSAEDERLALLARLFRTAPSLADRIERINPDVLFEICSRLEWRKLGSLRLTTKTLRDQVAKVRYVPHF